MTRRWSGIAWSSTSRSRVRRDRNRAPLKMTRLKAIVHFHPLLRPRTGAMRNSPENDALRSDHAFSSLVAAPNGVMKNSVKERTPIGAATVTERWSRGHRSLTVAARIEGLTIAACGRLGRGCLAIAACGRLGRGCLTIAACGRLRRGCLAIAACGRWGRGCLAIAACGRLRRGCLTIAACGRLGAAVWRLRRVGDWGAAVWRCGVWAIGARLFDDCCVWAIGAWLFGDCGVLGDGGAAV
jgi:hypothetical protein